MSLLAGLGDVSECGSVVQLVCQPDIVFQLYPECADTDDWRWLVLGLGICVLFAFPVLCLYARQQAERVALIGHSSGVCRVVYDSFV